MNTFDVLMDFYRKKNDREPEQDDVYVMQLITGLSKTYDDNFNKMLLAKNHLEKKELQQKEKYLNAVSMLLRKYADIRASVRAFTNQVTPPETTDAEFEQLERELDELSDKEKESLKKEVDASIERDMEKLLEGQNVTALSC